MKKLLSISIVMFAFIALVSCKGNSPSAVVEESIQCLIDKDYEGYVDYIAFNEDATTEEIGKHKAELKALFENKLAEGIEKRGGLKSYKVISEKIDEEKKTAVVKFEITYGDGSTEQQEQKMEQNKDGKWLMDCDK